MINKTKFAAVVAAASLFMTPLLAGGLSIGIIANQSDFNTKGYEKEGSGDQEINSGSITNTVDFASVFVEYMVGPDQGFNMTFGIEHIPDADLGAKSRTDVDGDSGADDDGSYTAKAEISEHVSVYAEPTIMFNENFGVFVKGGATHIRVRSLENLNVGDDYSEYGSESVFGVMGGIGVKAISPAGIFIKAEATKTEYGTVTLASSSGNKNIISAEPDQESVRFAIGYNF